MEEGTGTNEAPKIRYVRVRFPGSLLSERGVFLRVTKDTEVAIAGWEIDKDGEEVVPTGCERRLRIVARRAITEIREYEMDRKYETLVPKTSGQSDCERGR